MKLNKQQQNIIMVVVVIIVLAGFSVAVKQIINGQKNGAKIKVGENKYREQVKIKLNEEGKNAANSEKIINFSDSTLGISFSYPSFLGDVNIEKKDNAYYLMFGKDLFLVAINPAFKIPSRGGFFGDVGFEIKNEEYIKNYCKEKKSCNAFVNDNKVLIVKHDFIDFDSSVKNGLEDFSHYYIYNPKTEYAGIVISPIRLENKYKIDEINKAFDYIINSINF